jgi:putative hemolysin
MRILVRLRFALTFAASAFLIMVMAAKSTHNPAAIASWGDSSSQLGGLSQAHKISNPAAVYCTDMGFEYKVIKDGNGGQTDTCSMPDGKVCSAWDFLEGKCGQAYSYCARQGLGERTAADGNNPFSPEYAVCVDAQGKDVGLVTALFNLAPKLNRCGNASNLPDKSASIPASAHPAPADTSLALSDTPPASWDWRNATYNGISGDWTTPVKNQGGCGSCWAFSAVGQAEAVLKLASSDPFLDPDLSEEYLVSDCSPAGTCCGGWHSSALGFIKNQGIPDETCLPYVSGSCGCSGGGCSDSCANKTGGSCANSACSQRCSDYDSRLSHIDDYGSVNPTQVDIKQALFNYGPLSVAISMKGSFDGNGVYNCINPGEVNHSVVIVGYNDAGGYWIAKNSWGTGFGEAGYFNVGYGQCHIEDYVYYARVISTNFTNSYFFLPIVGR